MDPRDLIPLPPDELLELMNAALAELQRRTRPTPANAHMTASIRTVQRNMEDVERAHANLAYVRTQAPLAQLPERPPSLLQEAGT